MSFLPDYAFGLFTMSGFTKAALSTLGEAVMLGEGKFSEPLPWVNGGLIPPHTL